MLYKISMNNTLPLAVIALLLFGIISCDTAEEEARYEITTIVEPEYTGWFSVEPDKEYYREGEEITIEVEPGGRFSFDRWGGDLDEDLPNPAQNVIVEGNMEIIAHLEAGFLSDRPLLSPRNNTFYMEAPRDLYFVVHQNQNEFLGIENEGESIEPESEPITELDETEDLPDSKYIKLSSDQIANMGPGKHQIDFTFDDGTVLRSDIEVISEGEGSSHDLDIITFYVDHGDATLFDLPNGEIMMIDTGTRPAAEEYVVPFLKEYLPRDEDGNQRIDHIFITHWHYDHFEGLRAILPEFEVGEVYYNLYYPPNEFNDYDDHENPNDPYNFAQYGHKPEHHEKLEVGNVLTGIGGDNVEMQVLNAPVFDEDDEKFQYYRSEYFDDYDNRNNRSLSLRIEYNDFVYAHGGDIYEHAQEAILNTYEDYVRTHVYHGNHHFHGGISEEYLIATDPQLFLTSANPAAYDRDAYARGVLNEVIPELKESGTRFVEDHFSFEVGHSLLRIDGNRDWSDNEEKIPYETYFIVPDDIPDHEIPYILNRKN